jgi:hypothetical protein
MNGNRMRATALLIASAMFFTVGPATAARFDGNWSMVAETTRGHCGIIDVGLVISRGRIYSTSGSYAFNPIRLGGRVASSGYVRLNAVTGPRTAPAGSTASVGAERGLASDHRACATGSGTPIAINAGASLPRKS